MPELSFRVEGAEAVPFAAAPMLALKVRIENSISGETIQSISLRAQIQIEATRRRYTETEQQKLQDLFGEPDRWSRTLRTLLWTHANTVIPSFAGATVTDLPVPCTFDFNVAATKYFHAISGGEIPLVLLFSGTVFYISPQRGLQVAPISWDKEASFRLPAETWRGMMDEYYPNTAWIALNRDLFDRVYDFKVRHGLPTLDAAIEVLLGASAGKAATS